MRHIRVDVVRGIQSLMLNASREDYRRQCVNKLLPEKLHKTKAQGHLEVFETLTSSFVSSVRSSNSHPDLLLTHHHQQHPLFQITPVLNTKLSLSEPLQLYKGYNAI